MHHCFNQSYKVCSTNSIIFPLECSTFDYDFPFLSLSLRNIDKNYLSSLLFSSSCSASLSPQLAHYFVILPTNGLG